MIEHAVRMSAKQQIIGLIAWLILCFTASFIGALGSFQAPTFYAGLIQPAWAPPAWLFGPVWTTLYTMMAVAVWLVWRRGGIRNNSTALSLFLVQLVLNGLWSWMFFAWNLGAGSFVNIVALWLIIVATIVAFWRVDKIAGMLLVPYLFWVSFASALNYAMWQLNPQVLG